MANETTSTSLNKLYTNKVKTKGTYRVYRPKPFNTKSKSYKKARRSAGQKFGKKTSLVKNLYIAKKLKRR